MSIKEISQMTGLSITTVSHAINGTRVVSARSKKLVDDAVAEINYKPNLAAQMMKTQKSRIIALFVPDTEPGNSTNCFFFDVMNGARTYLESNGYGLIISTYPEYGEYEISDDYVLQHRWIDGILLVPPTNNYESIRKVRETGLPIVLIDRWVSGSGLPAVYSNNKEITKEAVSLIVRSGKKRVAFVGGPCNNSTAIDRLSGYTEALEAEGLPYDQALVQNLPRYAVESGEKAAIELLERGIDAVFAANSVLALGVVKALNTRGIKIPDQIAVVGYDSIGWMEITTPQLTTVIQNAFKMGEVASEVLIGLLNGRDAPEKELVIPAQIMMRGSH